MSAEKRHGEIGMSPGLAMAVIRDQAGSLVDAWREGGQNGVDSEGSGGFSLEHNYKRTIIRDDGNGQDLGDDEGESLVSDLGKSSKDRDDDGTIGHFGIGKGQIFAKARVTLMSGDTALHFDIKNWGLKFDKTKLEQEVDGFVVVMVHYQDEVPDEDSRKWDEYERDLKKRFKYLTIATGKRAVVNGECISDNDPEDDVRSRTHYEYVETEDAYIAISQSKWGNVSIYSNGIYVKDLPREGFGGVVITKGNLDLNFARNDILEGCDLWDTVQNQVDEVKKDLLESISDKNLNQKTRETVVRMMAEDKETEKRFQDKEVFKSMGGNYVSLEDIQSEDEIGVSETTNSNGNKVSERGDMVLVEETNSELLKEKDFETPEEFDVDERAMEHGVSDGYNTLHDVELSAYQRRRVIFAREMASRLNINRRIVWGADSSQKGWTDGESFIAVTDKIFEQECWITTLFHTLCEQSIYDSDSEGKGTATDFHRRFGRMVSDNSWTLEKMHNKYERNGITNFDVDMTEPEKERANVVTKELKEMEVGNTFIKNDDQWVCEVVDTDEDFIVIDPPRGEEVRIYFNGEDEFPVVDPIGMDQKIKSIRFE